MPRARRRIKRWYYITIHQVVHTRYQARSGIRACETWRGRWTYGRCWTGGGPRQSPLVVFAGKNGKKRRKGGVQGSECVQGSVCVQGSRVCVQEVCARLEFSLSRERTSVFTRRLPQRVPLHLFKSIPAVWKLERNTSGIPSYRKN